MHGEFYVLIDKFVHARTCVCKLEHSWVAVYLYALGYVLSI